MTKARFDDHRKNSIQMTPMKTAIPPPMNNPSASKK